MKGLIFRHRRMRRHLSEAQRDAVIVDEGSPQFNFAKSWKGQGRFLAAEGGRKSRHRMDPATAFGYLGTGLMATVVRHPVLNLIISAPKSRNQCPVRLPRNDQYPSHTRGGSLRPDITKRRDPN